MRQPRRSQPGEPRSRGKELQRKGPNGLSEAGTGLECSGEKKARAMEPSEPGQDKGQQSRRWPHEAGAGLRSECRT